METKNDEPKRELSDEDRMHIAAVFQEEMVPRLALMDARSGNLNCSFAGTAYRNWVICFKSAGSGFEIMEFEYDEESRHVNLPPQPGHIQESNHV